MHTMTESHRSRLSRRGLLLAAALVGTAVFEVAPARAAEGAVLIAPPVEDGGTVPPADSEVAVLAGGCFWGVQGVFQHVKGVTRAVSGYAGGDASTATYQSIGSGRTGHAEAVRISFDPRQISFGRILQIYFSVVHDPTQLDRQGPDRGTQYRSTIFAQSAGQAGIARRYIAQLDQARSFRSPLVTTVELHKPFYEAERYHQDYMALHPRQPYIVIHDRPKLENLKRVFPDRFRAEPMLVRASSTSP